MQTTVACCWQVKGVVCQEKKTSACSSELLLSTGTVMILNFMPILSLKKMKEKVLIDSVAHWAAVKAHLTSKDNIVSIGLH